MTNNFEKVREMLEFRSKDDFYFIQILQRKKDAKDGMKVNGTNNNSRLIKAYYVSSLEYFDFVMPEIIQLCELFNARAGINLNRRSYEKMALQNLQKVTSQIINKSFEKAYKSYPSVVGAFNHDTDKKWILDIDEPYNDLDFLLLKDYLQKLQPEGDKIIATLPSRNGYHIITKPFRLDVFKERNPEIEVHKNNPTNLYIT